MEDSQVKVSENNTGIVVEEVAEFPLNKKPKIRFWAKQHGGDLCIHYDITVGDDLGCDVRTEEEAILAFKAFREKFNTLYPAPPKPERKPKPQGQKPAINRGFRPRPGDNVTYKSTNPNAKTLGLNK